MKLHNVIPSAVIEFLREEGFPARTESLREISENIEGVGRDQSSEVPDAQEAAKF